MRLQDIGLAAPVIETGLPSTPAVRRTPQALEPLTVWLIDQPECEQYDAFVDRSGEATLYHSLRWRDALIATNAGEPFYLAAFRGDRVVGVLPLVERRDLWGRKRLVSLPSTPVAGPESDDDAAESVMIERAQMLARTRGVTSLVTRRFAPAAQMPSGNAVRDWIRVPMRQFLPYALSYESERYDYDPTPITAALLERMREGRPYAASSISDDMLRHLDGCGALTECSLACRPDRTPAGVLVWALHNRHLHVLSYSAERRDTTVCRSLIQSVLEPARSFGVEWIDLPLPRRFDAWFDGLSKLRGVEIATEERLALPRAV